MACPIAVVHAPSKEGQLMHSILSQFVCRVLAASGVAYCAMAGCAATPGQAELLVHHDVSAAVALSIAQGTLESCTSKGYAVSVVVVDRDGETIVAIRGDNASPHTMENARRKAYTAMSFKVPTTDYAKRFADNNPTVRQQVTLPNVIAMGADCRSSWRMK
jgi:uncharacterized protein GlcG (DUF336 family)